MDNELIDVRTPLAVSRNARVEVGQDGVVHVLVGPLTLHLERAVCEDLATTLARGMVRLAQTEAEQAPAKRAPSLELVR